MLNRRRLLLVDNRGTGRSEAILCQPLQSYEDDYAKAVGKCGRQLAEASDVYGSAFAADDLAAVLDGLEIDQVDLYGDSYGTFFSQSFAVRHPERVRSLVLDGAYFVAGTDPFYIDTNRAMRDAFRYTCERSLSCADRPKTTNDLIGRHPEAAEEAHHGTSTQRGRRGERGERGDRRRRRSDLPDDGCGDVSHALPGTRRGDASSVAGQALQPPAVASRTRDLLRRRSRTRASVLGGPLRRGGVQRLPPSVRQVLAGRPPNTRRSATSSGTMPPPRSLPSRSTSG